MALTGGETYGTVIPGFVTKADGSLSVTTDTGSVVWREGFLRDPDGRLVVADAGGIMQAGFLRTAGGALCVTTGSVTKTGTMIPGWPTDDEGRICVANDASPSSDVYPGFKFNGGKLCVSGLAAGPATLYSESFTPTGVGGWTTQNGFTFRDTSAPQSAPGCLYFGFNDFTTDCYALSPWFAATSIATVSFWLKKGGSIPADVNALIVWTDSGDTPVGTEQLDIFDNSFSSSWTSKSYGPFPAAPGGTAKAGLFMFSPDSNFWDGAGFYIDTIQVTGTP